MSGTITLTTGELSVTSDLTVTGPGASGLTTIATGDGVEYSRSGVANALITRSIITFDSTTDCGGVVGSRFTLTNATVSGNTVPAAGRGTDLGVPAGTVSHSYNPIGDRTASSAFFTNGVDNNQTGTSGSPLNQCPAARLGH